MTQQYFKINGKNKLTGEIEINGAKNSVLALMISSILTSNVVTLEDVPRIKDVDLLIEILKHLGANIIQSEQGKKHFLTIDNTDVQYESLEIDQVTKFRASYYLMGAMITKFKKCSLALPGGCYLGPRPIDLHLKGLRALGCEITETNNENGTVLDFSVPNGLTGNRIFLDFPSVGATINIIIAAVFAEGETIIENAAKEPEIVDVTTMLTSMGARIKGAGTNEIKIKGVDSLSGCYHQVLSDRIEAGTYIMFGALLGENLIIKNVVPEHLEALTSKLTDIGIEMTILDDSIKIHGRKDKLTPVRIKTGVFPSFATDLQQVFVTLLTQVEGDSKVIETIFPERFRNCDYLNMMGANTIVTCGEESGKVVVTGKTPLKGSIVEATDLRAGAAMIFAGLLADGETRVGNISHVLRGYDNIIDKLVSVGADISLVEGEIDEW